MTRRSFLWCLSLASLGSFLGYRGIAAHDGDESSASDLEKLEKTDAEWKELLSDEQYRVLFRDGTERAFSSPLDKEFGEGHYVCAACFLPLFHSDAKFDSGTGWPSFFEPLPDRVGTRRDFKMILPRTEYHCIRCGGHQGHVFNDGPEPTGRRWCNNGVALHFVPIDEPLPDLRS